MLGSHGGNDGETGAQPCGKIGILKLDFDGNTLHDFGVVPSRVIGWNRRKLRTAGRRDLNHFSLYDLPGKFINAYFRSIAGLHIRQLRLAERQGALVFQVKQCHNCHSLGNEGGKRGPALDAVAVRLTQDQLIRQVMQGGGNMPAYGKNLSPAQTTALVAFLGTLHPSTEGPAQNAARSVIVKENGAAAESP